MNTDIETFDILGFPNLFRNTRSAKKTGIKNKLFTNIK